VGSGIQAGDGKQLSLRLRLLAAAVGIVAVSLLMSGVLTWFLVRNLEFANAQEELDRSAVVYRAQVMNRQCLERTVTAVCPGGLLATSDEYESRLRSELASQLGDDRLLLLSPAREVVYDSQDPSTVGRVPIGRTRSVARAEVQESTFRLAGGDYLGAAVPLGRRDPLGAAYLVLARSRAAVAAQATAQLLPLLLLAGGVAMVFSLLIGLLISRALASPLMELADAAEDIAAGNYSRRVALTGRDEVGVVGRSFNRMAEAVERARSLQRDFLANVSHELKTPLTSLIGFSQALVDGSLETDGERQRAATILHEEAQRVLRMAQELLDLARVESGHLSLTPQPVDLAAMLQQELELVRARAGERGLELELALPADLPPVRADPERLHQILDNLLDNAVKYAPPGGAVWIRAEHTAEGVETSVANAVGDHPPDPARMFDRFYRADPSRSSAAGGVGLGLAISRELAHALQGRLWADLDGGGSLRLRLLLPAEAAGPDARHERQPARPPLQLRPRAEPPG
jgi:signal transduction histidine kinase